MANPVFYASLDYLDHSINLYRDSQRHWTGTVSFGIGGFFILFVLHLAFFLYSPAQKANLYFCLFALCVSLFQSLQIPVSVMHSVKYLFYNRILVLDFLIVSIFLL